VKKIAFYILFLAVMGTAFAGAYIEFFNAKSENGDIKLEWKVQDESNVKSYIVQRGTVQGNFVDLATVNPTGSYSYYTFTDETAYKTQDILFVYQLKIVDNNGSATYIKRSVSHNVSGVKRTWGSIKAMFR